MKRAMVIGMLALGLVFGGSASAFAASTASYSIVVPRFQANKYTTTKLLGAHKDFGVKHKYSGGKPIRFVMCNSSKQPIGSAVSVYPGGAYAPLVDLYYNSSASSQYVLVCMDSAKWNVVEILCEGTWVWNY